jgi:1,4-dihydroxy-2-naphthoyl-CoA hydrolase
MIWKTPVNLETLNKKYMDSLSHHLGIEFVEAGVDFLTARMPVDKRTLQPAGILHGGASCALAETIGSVAATLCIDIGYIAVGIEINANHMKSVKGGHVTGIGRPLHIGRTTQVWEIKIYNEKKELTSACRLTVAVVAKR